MVNFFVRGQGRSFCLTRVIGHHSVTLVGSDKGQCGNGGSLWSRSGCKINRVHFTFVPPFPGVRPYLITPESRKNEKRLLENWDPYWSAVDDLCVGIRNDSLRRTKEEYDSDDDVPRQSLRPTFQDLYTQSTRESGQCRLSVQRSGPSPLFYSEGRRSYKTNYSSCYPGLRTLVHTDSGTILLLRGGPLQESFVPLVTD